MSIDPNAFQSPPVEFRPVPFWSWNEVMQADEVRRQVDLLADAGWGGAFIHARVGLITRYLGQEWFGAVDACIDQSRKRGLKIWFYDEDKWPSGFSGGSVPLADPAFRFKTLLARRVDQSHPPGAQAIGDPANSIQVYAWTSPLGHDWFNGTCYTDLLNKDAVRKFLDDAYEPYFRRYAQDYGGLIMAAFTDEPAPIFLLRLPEGSVPFTPAVIEQFRQKWGYDPTPQLFRLFVDDPHSARFRLHYFCVVNDLFEHHFTAQLGHWCQQHGIFLTGHFLVEGSLYDQQAWGARHMPNYRHMQIPGIDHLGRQIQERITARQCHSVVNQYGKRRMMSELYGCSGGSLSFEDRWWMGCQQICLGVNLLVPHLSLFTMSGCRKRDYPQNMFYPQPWWPMNSAVDLPLSRLCYALAQGCYVAEALVIHPQESVFALWQAKIPQERPDQLVYDPHATTPQARQRIDQLDADVKSVIDRLLGAQRTFDFGDEVILADDGAVERAASGIVLCVGQMRYPAAVLPSMVTIRQSTFDLLRAFHAAGGIVLRCGDAPALVDGLPSEELARWIESVPSCSADELAGRLAAACGPAVQLTGDQPRQLYTHIRDLDDGNRLVFLTNLDRLQSVDVRVDFAGGWQSAQSLDVHTGQTSTLTSQPSSAGLGVDLHFASTQAHLICLSKQKASAPASVGPSFGREIEIPREKWTIQRLDDNALTLDLAEWKLAGDFSSRPMPIIAIQRHLNQIRYDGLLTLRYRFCAGQLDRDRRVHLVLEYPDRYAIRVNDIEVKYQGLKPWRDCRWMPIDIGALLRPGDNVIELHCPSFQHGDLTSVHDQFARYGTEIESIYLVGDFSVTCRHRPGDHPVSPMWNQWALPPIGVSCFDGPFELNNPGPLSAGDTTVQGMPFYAGRIRVTMPMPTIPGDGALLSIGQLDAAVAQVDVDGRPVGCIMSHPLQLRIPRGQEIGITHYGTLRNLLGPHHHVEGELCAVGPYSFYPHLYSDAAPDWFEQWSSGQNAPPDWSDRYCMVSFGEIGNVELLV